MPILGFPVVETPELIGPDLFADSRSFAFRALGGGEVLPCTGEEFIALWGTQGLDVPPREIVEEQIPGLDGSRITDIKIGPRSVVLPLWVGSDSGHLAYLTNRATLRRLFNHRGIDYRANDGHLDLVATSVLGERYLRVAYLDGMPGDWTQDASGSYWERVALQFRVVRPYWHGERWTTPVIRPPEPASFLGPFPPQLSSSQALGEDIPVAVDGEVESWTRIDLVGPATEVTIEAQGVLVEIPDGLASGEPAVIDLNPRSTRATFGGVTDWTRIAPSYRRAPLAPGVQLINISLPGAGSTTTAVVSGDTLWETPW